MTIMLKDEARIYRTGLELRTDVEKVNGHDFLHGRAVPYSEIADIGWFLEDHAPGSLAKSIKEAARGLPLLMFHNASTFPIGVSDTWEDGTEGLDAIWKLDGSEEAQRAASLAKPDADGKSMLGYMSIRFQPIRSQWTYVDDWNPDLGADHKDKVTREESRLVEVSLVSTPAFTGATVNWVRSNERALHRDATGGKKLEAWQKELDKLRGPVPDTP